MSAQANEQDRGAASTLVIAIGENPLPALQAITTICPSNVVLFTGPEATDVADHVRDAVGQLAQNTRPRVSILNVARSNDARLIQETLSSIPPGWALCYSDGPPVFVAQTRLAYERRGDGSARHAGVIDGVLRRDDGSSQPIAAATVNLQAIARLHGHRLAGGTQNNVTVADISRVEDQLLARIRSAAVGKPAHAWSDRELAQIPKRPRTLLTDHGGFWFERIVAAFAESSGQFDEVVLNTVLRLNGATQDAPEFDVIVRRGWDTALISCTVDKRRMARKNKLIEVAHRARQLGGDQAHAVLVCLGTPAECDNLQADLGDLGPTRHVRVIGKSAIISWIKGSPFPAKAIFDRHR